MKPAEKMREIWSNPEWPNGPRAKRKKNSREKTRRDWKVHGKKTPDTNKIDKSGNIISTDLTIDNSGDITLDATTGGGSGGHRWNQGGPGAGGSGGGGVGGNCQGSTSAGSGTVNTGSGGGGGGGGDNNAYGNGAAGGSGIVIIRYQYQ